ncbi:hypothetical protein HUJ05_004640 [Dendroctonus ponderosae]|nr:hypothetical protein HUJ05_008624 [Dendroctonus ponderosae]KAH1000035.1 hypothetical protein HUJ05_008624 [Dendroctonus ponderosae]KAH1010334.1 hypothetical protein HUJ05_004640 [Dendroctonus ponderosae]KAH1010335.1 hypothetical protein HUJ05_004640 [Dendroctonus ponderosae]
MKPNMPIYKKHHCERRSDGWVMMVVYCSSDIMDDDSDDKDSKRKSRNLSEKKRRDQFNLLVNELSSMVSTSSRKMDKSTVLKSTISFLKNHNEIAARSRINEIQEDWKPTFLTNEEFTHLVLEAADGFIIVFSTSGQIHYSSESITSLLGYLPKDILKMSILDVVCEEDQNGLYGILSNSADDENPVSFSCHLKRAGPDADRTHCELVNFVGYFRSDEDVVQETVASNLDNGRMLFVGTGKLQTPLLIKEIPLVDSSRTEFTSRHSLEWKFLFLDHRAPPIIGYLPFELLGTSGYEYYHVDDLDSVINCHESLMQKGEGTSCYYRFLTKGQQWIWLQTRFYITYHQWNSKPEFVVCTHRVVSYLDVIKQSRRSQGMPSPSEEAQDSSSSAWRGGDSSKGPDSKCTSMSADSPASRQSAIMEKSAKAGASPKAVGSMLSSPHQPEDIPRQAQPLHLAAAQLQNQTQYLDPSQFAALQPVATSYQPQPVLLSPLSVENVVITPAPNQLQVNLQRKQAELQAIIEQQQQELRRVSEQLLMARLGLLQNQQNQNSINTVQQYPQNSSGTVSSTTAPIPVLPGTGSNTAPVSAPISVTVASHQSSGLYNTSDSK